MIDMEPEVLQIVTDAAGNGVEVSGEYPEAPASFPLVTVREIGNSVYQRTASSAGLENHASIAYEINVFSAKINGKKRECKDIAQRIDAAMLGRGFYRTMLSPIPNYADKTIYRITARYGATVDKNKNCWRR